MNKCIIKILTYLIDIETRVTTDSLHTLSIDIVWTRNIKD
jgi:hypothetical protein